MKTVKLNLLYEVVRKAVLGTVSQVAEIAKKKLEIKEDYVGEIIETEYEFGPANPKLRNKVYVDGFINGMNQAFNHCLNLLEHYKINPALKEKVLK